MTTGDNVDQLGRVSMDTTTLLRPTLAADVSTDTVTTWTTAARGCTDTVPEER